MLQIWWSGFLVPVVMLVLCAVVYLRRSKGTYTSPRRPLTAQQRQFADEQLMHLLWRVALLFAALAFMVMRSVRLMEPGWQRLLSYLFLAIEVVAAACLVIPVERAIDEQFGADAPEESLPEAMEHAPAKVNLLLLVGKKRDDGYHDLVSVMQTVGVCDEVTVRARPGGGITLACDCADLPVDETNLAYRAAIQFFSYTGIENKGIEIVLKKTLPMQAGLGGGSADAAAVLRALRTLYAPELPLTELEQMAAPLGSDVPFCVRGGTALVLGRGERLESLEPLKPCWFVLVKPSLAFSTGKMYGEIDQRRCYDEGDARAMIRALAAGDLAAVCDGMENTFEKVLPPDSEIFAIRRRLLSFGALGAMMSGSGSSVFGIFRREEEARMACGALRSDYPQVFCGISE